MRDLSGIAGADGKGPGIDAAERLVGICWMLAQLQWWLHKAGLHLRQSISMQRNQVEPKNLGSLEATLVTTDTSVLVTTALLMLSPSDVSRLKGSVSPFCPPRDDRYHRQPDFFVGYKFL